MSDPIDQIQMPSGDNVVLAHILNAKMKRRILTQESARQEKTSFDQGLSEGVQRAIAEVKSLCQDHSAQNGSVFIGDVHAALDAIAQRCLNRDSKQQSTSGMRRVGSAKQEFGTFLAGLFKSQDVPAGTAIYTQSCTTMDFNLAGVAETMPGSSGKVTLIILDTSDSPVNATLFAPDHPAH